MADPTLYLFDGYNLLHAGDFADPRELVDTLASFVAARGVRGVVVFDGAEEERQVGQLWSGTRPMRTTCSSGLPRSTEARNSCASCPRTMRCGGSPARRSAS